MKITYTGNQESLAPKQRDKFEIKLQKMSKMLDRGRGEREAHVIITKQRFLHKVEITINAFDHAMVCVGSDSDLLVAMSDALEKLEKQIIRLRSKWRDSKRHKDKEAMASVATEPASATAPTGRTKALRAGQGRAEPPAGKKTPRVFRVNHKDGRKPMTLEEAMLEVEESQDYLVYHDAGTDRLTVLLRRADGNFDLIES
jgi:ribosome hibernation promoting factor